MYCGVLISCLNSQSGTHSLQRIHWWVKWCNVTFLQIYSDEEANPSPCWTAWQWVNFQQIFIFWVNYSFKGSCRPIKIIVFMRGPYWNSLFVCVGPFFNVILWWSDSWRVFNADMTINIYRMKSFRGKRYSVITAAAVTNKKEQSIKCQRLSRF